MKRLCQVFRSSSKEEMYLYVDKANGIKDVPEVLMKQFGDAKEVMTIYLGADRKLARANAAEVLAGIEEQGFYLQMPPTMAELLKRDGNAD